MLTSLARTSRFFADHPLTKNDKARAWARFAAWQMRSRLHDEIIVPWIEGQRLAVRRGMWGATGNIYAGLHEFSEMMLVLHFLRPGDLFVDVGANVGSYTVLASGVAGADTIAFEPAPDTAALLRRNIEINRLDSLVTVHEMAASASDGHVSFTSGRGPENAVSADGTNQVRAVRLDGVLRGKSPAMLKIDAEGHDGEVIKGAEAILAGESLKVVIAEAVAPSIRSTLADHGFSPVTYDPIRRALLNDTSAAVFVRDRGFVAARLATAESITVLGRKI